MSDETRIYRKRRRAEQEEATRERIAGATAALHETVGPAHTTVKAIAERAGVQRATVYRHFPDDQALFDACTAHYYRSHPMPDPARWAAIPDPGERLRRGLAELYAWYRETEPMVANSIRDMTVFPPGTQAAFQAFFEAAAAALLAGRTERGRARTRVTAAIRHAIGFPAWRSLTELLRDEEAIALMEALVVSSAAAGRGAASPARPR